MNILESFMADIIANPADDTPRLIYADWLEDHGEEEKAHYIRGELHSSRTYEVEPGRAAEVTVFLDPMSSLPPVVLTIMPALGHVSYVLSRGFVSSITCTSADFLAHAPAILSAQPIETVTLTDWEVVAHEDMNDFETDKFLVRMQTGSLGAANLWNAMSEYIPTLHDDAASALATFSQTLILWGQSRIKPLQMA